MTYNLNPDRSTLTIIRRIASRALRSGLFREIPIDELDLTMDITATHLNGCPLELTKLLHADEALFLHDIHGIYTNLNRQTGHLKNCFLPKSAV